MNQSEKVVIVYNKINWSSLDELDVLVQVDFVESSLRNLGYKVYRLTFSKDINTFIETLEEINPAFVFNLVESFEGNGELLYLASSILEYLKIDYTGGSVNDLFITTNKILTKKYLKAYELDTADWVDANSTIDGFTAGKYIVKPVSEEASIDITNDSVLFAESFDNLKLLLKQKKEITGREYFAEKYINGREFNISMYGNSEELTILDPAEILFLNKTNSDQAILNYEAKWFENSNDYKNSVRIFNFGEQDYDLIRRIKENASKCWKAFKLNGYARIDYRVDSNGRIWILEINSNPCISPDSGFVAAAINQDIDYTKLVFEIIHFRNRFKREKYERIIEF